LSQAMPGVHTLWSSDPWRVKDLAYQILCNDRGIAIRMNDDYAKRDALIAAFLEARSTGNARQRAGGDRPVSRCQAMDDGVRAPGPTIRMRTI
jgi:hypothetical protein